MNSIFNNLFFTKHSYIAPSKTKCRLYGSTKLKHNKEKEKKLKKISKASKRINRSKRK